MWKIAIKIVCIFVCMYILHMHCSFITGTMVALHPSKAHVQSRWERANFDRQWHQNPWNFSNLNLTFMITSWISTPMQIFISIRSAGFSPQIGEILRFCYSWLYCILFLRNTRRSNRGWIFTVYGSYDVFSPMDSPFGDCNNIRIHLG